MPEPADYNSEDEFMAACVPMRIEEGDDQDQAVAVCMSMWGDHKAAKSEPIVIFGEVKAAGDWELDVLGVPFGGPNGGKDSDGEYFTPNTKTHTDKYPNPPVVYYHGLDPNGKPMGEPAIIGSVKRIWQDVKGWWYKVVLDKASEYARRIWDAAKEGRARASSGSIIHMVRKEGTGEITNWPVAELSLIDADGRRQPANQYAVALVAAKAVYQQAGIELPAITEEGGEPETDAEGQELPAPVAHPAKSATIPQGVLNMDEKEVSKLVAEGIAEAMKADRAAREAAEAAAKAEQERIDAAVKAALEKEHAEAAKARRLPDGAPYIAKEPELWQFDNLDASDQAVLVGVLEANSGNKHGKRPSEAAYKALAQKIHEDKSIVGHGARLAMKAAGYKSDEVDYSTLASYGDDWVGVAYSNAIWEAIRVGTPVVAKLPSVEVPRGTESIILPLEGTDPTFYKVAENTTYDSTMKYPVPTITSSQMGTAKVTLSLSKLGARVLWTGELEERSLIPFAAQLRQQLQTVGAEYLESAVIDGDNVTTATTNINDIAATGAQTGTEYYLLFDGFRVSPLVTTTANSRSAAGGLDVTDYLETVKLMGGAGINALDTSKVSFIVDPNTYYKSLTLPEVLTRDVFASPAIEGGKLRGLFGYELITSANMHRMSTVRKANSAGKVDQDTTGNNAYGAILAVRWDQWKFGFQRRMTLEVDRFAASDTNEIVAMMTCGLIQRDTEASAITYYVGV